MCKEEQDEENGIEEQEYYSKDEVLDIIEEITPRIEINTELFNGFELDEDMFKEGLKNISFYCGQFIGLVSVGVNNQDAFQFILNESTGRSNVTTTKEQTIQTQIQQEQNQI